MGRCEICGQVNGHAAGCPNEGQVNNNASANPRGEIRCGFCNTLNPAGATRCRSCNAVLDGQAAPSGNRIYQREMPGSSQLRPATVCEDESVPSLACPDCGYPLRSGSDKCPACGKNISQSADNSPNQKQPTPANRNDNQSVPVWNTVEQTSRFSIGLCDAEGKASSAASFEGEEVTLGREELLPGNNHISRQHIRIIHEDNKWYVEDVSSTHQTYLIVKGKTPIEDGDVLVLGNKFFRFQAE